MRNGFRRPTTSRASRPRSTPASRCSPGVANPVPAERVAYDPAKNMMQAIYDADSAAGGTLVLVRLDPPAAVLERRGGDALLTRGRALYMNTHTPGTLGFAGGYAYRERPTGASQNLYTIAISGTTLAETTAQRVQYPSYFQSRLHGTGSLSVAETKFITYNDTAVTELKVTNTGTDAVDQDGHGQLADRHHGVEDGTELTGSVTIRYGLTTVTPRLSGEGFTVSGTTLTRDVTLDPGASIDAQGADGHDRRRAAGLRHRVRALQGLRRRHGVATQKEEYNQFWADNVPYVDIPDANVKKISYYRTWENRFNTFDGNIPGNDYQFPVDLEGALGYNNQISLTVPMRMQDLKWWRDPLLLLRAVALTGRGVGLPGVPRQPGQHRQLEQHLRAVDRRAGACQSYMVHGGPKSILQNLAKYSECDVKGTLAKFDTNHNGLIEYNVRHAARQRRRLGRLPAVRHARRRTARRPRSGTPAPRRPRRSTRCSATRPRRRDERHRRQHQELDPQRTCGPTARSATARRPATGPRVAGKLGNAVKLSGTGE